MAPMKRSRRALDEEEFDVVDVQSAQSSLRQDSVRLTCDLHNLTTNCLIAEETPYFLPRL